MKCKRCGNTTEFTMVREIAFWNDKQKRFDDATSEGDEYYVCDTCMNDNEEGKYIDTEGDY